MACPASETPSAVPSAQRVVHWYVSRRCNLACKHCWLNCSPYVDVSKELSTSEALGAVARIKEFGATVVLTGGEALFRPDFLLIFEALIDAGINTMIETNGLLVSPRLIELLRRAKRARLGTGISISLDGGTKEAHEQVRGQGTFERTLAAMWMLKDAGVAFEVQCILHRKNVETIGSLFEQMVRFAPQLGQLAFGFMNPVGRGLQLEEEWGLATAGREEAYRRILNGMSSYPGKTHLKAPPALIPPSYFAQFIQHQGHWRCSTTCAFPVLGILPDGHITVCALTGDNPSLYFGDIRTDSLRQIWTERRMDLVRSKYLEAKLSGICSDCIFRSYCRGSCRTYAYEEFGQFSAPFPLCDAVSRRGEFPRAYRISCLKGTDVPQPTSDAGSDFIRQYVR